jgi:hypothetical protein
MWWNKDDSKLTYCSYKVNQTEVMVGPRLDYESRGCSQKFFDSVSAWLSVTESYIEYPITANVRWFPWKEGIEPLPDHALYGSLKHLDYWINKLKLPRVYIHCDLGTHRAPSVFGAFLLGFYPEQFDKITDARKVFNKKNSTIISTTGQIMGEPRYYIDSYLAELPLLETMIKTIVKHPQMSLRGVIEQTFKDRPLDLYTNEERSVYDAALAEENYHKRFKEWIASKGFVFDQTQKYYTIMNVTDPNGQMAHIVSDKFRLDILNSFKKYGRVYFSYDKEIPDLKDLGIIAKEVNKETKDDLVLVLWEKTND